MKPYDVGLICGRFQTFHKGHEKLVDTGLMLCDRLLILIGSAQECGTERNPLNINTRTKMLKEIYGDYSDQIIAECIFEEMTDGSASTTEMMTEKEADDYIQKYISER